MNLTQFAYMVLIGWWLAMLWFIVGLALCVTIVGYPVGLVMIYKTPDILFGPS